MGYISALFALRVAELATAGSPTRHAQRIALCRDVGIDPVTPLDHKRMIRDTDFFGLLERVASEFEDGRSIAIRVGASMRCDDYGAFGLAFKTATDLWGSFKRVERYGRVVTSIANFKVVHGNGSAFMAVRRDTVTRLGLELTNELAVAAATALCREVCQEDFAPVAVLFSHERPTDLSTHREYFRCPVIYRADRDGLEISDELLYAGNRLGDESVSEFFDAHLEKELAELVDDSRLDQRVCMRITQALSEGVPTVSEIAGRLGMSSRTLQRRLADQGHIYQDLVDETRRNLAVRLLGRDEFSLAEIAFLTGYAEQSTFTRAFKRWHGQTPANYRRAMQHPG